MRNRNKLVVATYNLQFSLHLEEVKDNILSMVGMGVNLFCLQEVINKTGKVSVIELLLNELGSNWRAVCNLGTKKTILGMGNCIIWNTNVLTLKKEQKEFLPIYNRLGIHEKIFSWFAGGTTAPFQRRVIIGQFKLNEAEIRITNLHLDQNGGLMNRRKQLLYLMNILRKNKFSKEIICGDFNSFDLLKKGKEAKMQKNILGNNFIDASRKSGWTADLNDIYFEKGSRFLTFLIKNMRVHVRRKLDYIWIKNIKCLRCDKLLLNGSDHNPIIVYLEV
ncbi:MAG: hypothetical protein WD992_02390 [Candidatus Levyibacteriota bacterium]